MQNKRASLLIMLTLLLSVPNTYADTLTAAPFGGRYQAEYRVYWHGVYTAKAHYHVNKVNHNQYLAHTHIAPRFRFIPFEYDEKSHFTDTGTAIKPLTFTYHCREKKEALTGSFHFEAEKQAGNPLQDKISLVFQIGRLLEQSTSKTPGTKWSFQVVEAKKQKKVTIEVLAEETIKTALGRLRTLKVKQSAEASERSTNLWFAIEQQFLLVKIAQYRKGHLIGYTTIQRLTHQ